MKKFPPLIFRPPPADATQEHRQTYLSHLHAWLEEVEYLLAGQLGPDNMTSDPFDGTYPNLTADESITGQWQFTKRVGLCGPEDVASAAELLIDSECQYINLTGGTTLTALSLSGQETGDWLLFRLDSATTFTHDATALQLLGGVDAAFAAGDHTILWCYDGTNWREVVRLSGVFPALWLYGNIRLPANQGIIFSNTNGDPTATAAFGLFREPVADGLVVGDGPSGPNYQKIHAAAFDCVPQASRPTGATSGTFWCDNAGPPRIPYFYDGSNDIEIASINGQIGGTAQSPDVRGVRETGGPTLLTMGAVTDGQLLKRSGTTITSVASGTDYPKGHIHGGKLQWTSATTVTILADCEARDDSDAGDINLTANQAVVITTAGANGLDTGSEASSTWYYVWLIGKTDGTVAGLLSVSATAPTLPTGYTLQRLLGAVYNDSSSNFQEFECMAHGAMREFWWRAEQTAFANFSSAVTAFRQDTIPLTGVPGGGYVALVKSTFRLAAASITKTFYVRETGSSATGRIVQQVETGSAANVVIRDVIIVPVRMDASRQIDWKHGETGNPTAHTLICAGFRMDL